MELWDRLVTLFKIMRGSGLQRYELTGRLQTVLLVRANREPRPVEATKEQLEAADKLKQLWDSLTDREKEITALTCQGYTNRQIAARLRIAVNTVKGYVKQALVKYQLHSKAELRKLLEEWDFSDWAPPAP
jgi:DNA-binding CsgD family transcriptional regulator